MTTLQKDDIVTIKHAQHLGKHRVATSTGSRPYWHVVAIPVKPPAPLHENMGLIWRGDADLLKRWEERA